jgi:hypothetical protein
MPERPTVVPVPGPGSQRPPRAAPAAWLRTAVSAWSHPAANAWRRARAGCDTAPRAGPGAHLVAVGACVRRALLLVPLAAVLLAGHATVRAGPRDRSLPPDLAVRWEVPLGESDDAPWLSLVTPPGWWREPAHTYRTDGWTVGSPRGRGEVWMRVRDPKSYETTARLFLEFEPLGKGGAIGAFTARCSELARTPGVSNRRSETIRQLALGGNDSMGRKAYTPTHAIHYVHKLDWATPKVTELIFGVRDRLVVLTYQHVGGKSDMEDIWKSLSAPDAPSGGGWAKMIHHPQRVARYFNAPLPVSWVPCHAESPLSAAWRRRGHDDRPAARLTYALVQGTSEEAFAADVARLHRRRASNPLLEDVAPPVEIQVDEHPAYLCTWTDTSGGKGERALHVAAVYVEVGRAMFVWTLSGPDPPREDLEVLAAQSRHWVGMTR